jgi:hypothetical protein
MAERMVLVQEPIQARAAHVTKVLESEILKEKHMNLALSQGSRQNRPASSSPQRHYLETILTSKPAIVGIMMANQTPGSTAAACAVVPTEHTPLKIRLLIN